MDSVSQGQDQYIRLMCKTGTQIAVEAVLMPKSCLLDKVNDFIEHIAFHLRALSEWLRS